MSLTAAELRAVYVVDEGPLDKSLAGLSGKVGKVKPGDVKIDGDDTGLQRTIVSAQGGMGRLSSTVKSSLGAIAGYFAFDAVARFVGSTISAASDLGETINKSNAIFGENAAVVNRWAQGSVEAVGLSRQAALAAASGFGDMFMQLGFAGDEAANLSTRVVQMSADLGSFNNLGTEDVADRISAAFRGEYDSLQLLIPNINAARVETEAMAATGKKNAAELTAQEKAAAVLAIVQRDGARAMGDFARTSDEFAGSQKKLSAEWGNAKARLGELLVGPLTGIVQFLTGAAIPAFDAIVSVVGGAVSMFANLPGPVQAALVTMAALALLTGPLAGGFTLLGDAALGFAGRAIAATSSMAAFRAAAGGMLGVIGGPWGLAIAGAVAGLTMLVSWLGESDDATSASARITKTATEAQQSYRQALEATNGVITESTRRSAAKALQDDGLLRLADQLKISTSEMTDSLLGNKDAYDNILPVLEAYHTQLLLESASDRTHGTENKIAALEAQIAAYKELVGTQPDVIASEKEIAEATDEAGGSMTGAASAAEDWATQLEGTQKAASGAKQATDLLKLSLDILTGATVSMGEVEAAFWAAVADADGALKDMTGSVLTAEGALNLHSEAGRATQDVLFGVRDSANQWIATMVQQGATSDQVNAKDAELRQSFYDTALALTGNAQAAEDLTNRLYGIPGERQTTITADTAQADAALAETERRLALIKSKTVTVTTLGVHVGNTFGGGTLLERAEGGPVWPGRTFLVGERGPELVQFGASGFVTPAGMSAQLMAAGNRQAEAGLTARIPVGAAPSRPAAAASGEHSAASAGGPLVNIEGDYVAQNNTTPAQNASALAVEVRTRPWT